MRNVGVNVEVMLSDEETPLSEIAKRSGAPGAPGSRLSTVTLRLDAETSELPAEVTFEVNT